MKSKLAAGLLASACCMATGSYAASAAPVQIDADDIGGVVKSAKGPEAGVWVIAETKDLKTPFAKIVATDDQGRYVLPDLPPAKYKVWVRGYGLVDSKPVDGAPGKTINLTATVAPTPQDAAQIYPPQYWSAMLHPPKASEFPGTGPNGNGISPGMTTQQNWLHHMQEECMFCHQLGDKATRELADTGNSIEAWDQRIQRARANGDPNIHNEGASLASTMNNNMTRYGRGRGLAMFADWTDRIKKGEVPAETPPRPQGVERNVVVTVRDYAHGSFIHDQVSSDRRHPEVNGNGPIYGLAMLISNMEILDPVTNTTTTIPIPSVDGSSPHDDSIRIHHDQMDEKGRVWMATVSRNGPLPAFCTDGSIPSSKYFPLDAPKGQPFPMYDPATKKINMFQLCSGGNHISFGWDKDSTVYLNAQPWAMSWLKTKVWDETHDMKKAYAWCPLVVDTNGDGKIDPDRTHWNKPDQPVDPKKDTQLNTHLYGLNVGKDGNVWSADYVPYVPSRIVRLNLGSNPPETCKAEVYEPPKKDGAYQAFGVRGLSVDSDGVVWAAFSSGHVGAFDRRKCKVTNGPSALGQQCPEGWKIYDLPGPKMVGTNITTNIVYGSPVDFENVSGLGADTVFFPAMNSDSILALDRKTDKFLIFRVPYPMGFYTRDMHFRIDDPKTGWKGRTIHATYSDVAMWHQEDGEGAYAKIATFQIRPDPLAH